VDKLIINTKKKLRQGPVCAVTDDLLCAPPYVFLAVWDALVTDLFLAAGNVLVTVHYCGWTTPA